MKVIKWFDQKFLKIKELLKLTEGRFILANLILLNEGIGLLTGSEQRLNLYWEEEKT